MNYITLEAVNKSYGEKILLDNIDLRINRGDKIALIAQNGSGKTTLMRILSGIISPEGEHAKVLVSPNIRVGYLDQEPEFEAGQTIRDAILTIDLPEIKAWANHHNASLSADEEALQHSAVHMDDHNAWDVESTILQLLHQLHFEDPDKPISQLSGGQKKRLALAMVILAKQDVVVLDEPTNHLDMMMVEWLENYLSQSDKTFLVVTHDRYFLDRVCNQILELDRGQLRSFQGNYSDYLEKKAAMMESMQSSQEKAKQLMKKELEWIRRMPKARTTKNKARIDNFENVKASAARVIYQDSVHMEIDMQRLGSKILECHNLGFYYTPDHWLIKKFDYKFPNRDRVGIIGPNGAGKSTFISLLTGELKPTAGKVVHGDTLKIGRMNQDGLKVEVDKRLIDIVRDIADYIPLKGGGKITAEQLLERFLFPRPQQQVYYSQISGGERRRLYLLTILMSNPNMLILDEPTNDLDILTLNVLEDFLMEFPGVVILASHDRYMLDKLADHLFVLEGDGFIKDFPGGYTAYSVYKENQVNATDVIPDEKDNQHETQTAADRQEVRKALRRAEKSIEQLEKTKKKLEENFLRPDPSLSDLQRWDRELKDTVSQLGELELKWMELAEQLETI
ncbi:MAG: ABC-F family ATP-binding cassette domain-containing protein [Saprospiraceae bacterium]|uniref:ABC-F family ATP-binding cassette domain-containing protein n=1 Tax=Candidatus Opimibacter skivensis TaxID=2982028 RepID=A0A9D7SSE0_9BACT|nr:ABC-F family ATP-binding cassette domain-containing protein [Candidatus Opimibacter skivensis]